MSQNWIVNPGDWLVPPSDPRAEQVCEDCGARWPECWCADEEDEP